MLLGNGLGPDSPNVSIVMQDAGIGWAAVVCLKAISRQLSPPAMAPVLPPWEGECKNSSTKHKGPAPGLGCGATDSEEIIVAVRFSFA